MLISVNFIEMQYFSRFLELYCRKMIGIKTDDILIFKYKPKVLRVQRKHKFYKDD